MSHQYVRSWRDAVALLRFEAPRTVLRVPKVWLPHPLTAGMTTSIGLPEGQLADYRLRLQGTAGLHVKDFGEHYEIHVDEVHPDVNPIEHLRRDSPGTFVAGGAALGALIGSALGKKSDSVIGGAVLGGILAALLASNKDSK